MSERYRTVSVRGEVIAYLKPGSTIPMPAAEVLDLLNSTVCQPIFSDPPTESMLCLLHDEDDASAPKVAWFDGEGWEIDLEFDITDFTHWQPIRGPKP